MLFNPLGLISPFVIMAQMLLQTLWSRGYDWNDIIVDEVAKKLVSGFDIWKVWLIYEYQDSCKRLARKS